MKKAVLWLPVRLILFIILFTVPICFKVEAEDLVQWWSVIASVVNISIILALLIYCKKKQISYGQLIQIQNRHTKWYVTVLLIFAVICIGMGGMYLAGFLCYGEFPYMATMMVKPIPVIAAVVNFLLLPITTTLAEDGLYLGIGVNQSGNRWVSILLPAFFYALQHSFIPVIWDINYMVYRFLSFLPLTVFICIIYYKKRNPLPIISGHFILNLATTMSILIFSLNPEWIELM